MSQFRNETGHRWGKDWQSEDDPFAQLDQR